MMVKQVRDVQEVDKAMIKADHDPAELINRTLWCDQILGS